MAHRLFRSHRTGAIINPLFTRFSFPPHWHFDFLRALDYFQAVNAPRDRRLAEAVEIVRGARGKDGRWPLQKLLQGQDLLRAGTAWCAKPLEHPPRNAGSEVVGGQSEARRALTYPRCEDRD